MKEPQSGSTAIAEDVSPRSTRPLDVKSQSDGTVARHNIGTHDRRVALSPHREQRNALHPRANLSIICSRMWNLRGSGFVYWIDHAQLVQDRAAVDGPLA